MHFESLNAAIRHPTIKAATGPVAVIICEDDVEIDSTVEHHARIGFRTIIVAAAVTTNVPEGPAITRIDFPTRSQAATETLVTAITRALPKGTWLYYGYNAEYLYFPYAETRTVGEMLAFHTEERRSAMLAYVVDLYAPDLNTSPNAVSRETAHFDRTGYYAKPRNDPDRAMPHERQMDFHGGLKWRFEEHIPEERRHIDRIPLVRTAPGLTLRDNHTWSDEELNTYACPWHNNLTAAVASFRAAKALRTNPSSRDVISTFQWHNSTPFEWSSQQLMDLGLMEPGQWF